MKDTIVALATPTVVAGAIAVIRLSGERALELALRVFTSKQLKSDNIEPNKMYLGKITTKNFCDRAFCMYCRAPKSYTGEDVAELQTHGGKAIAEGIVRELVACGARPAEPGEFTRRAYLNGKLDLAEAEGLADMINAESEAEVMQGYRLMGGELSKSIAEIKGLLEKAFAVLEAALILEDEPIWEYKNEALGTLTQAKEMLTQHADDANGRRLLSEGVTLVLAGLTNVGKSSLMNSILKSDRAIVTEIAGTTRDTLRESFALDGVKINVVDTAGIRESADPVEQLGVDRAKAAVSSADLVLFITDTSVPESEEEKSLYALVADRPNLRIANKNDIARYPRAADLVIEAKSGKGVPELIDAVVKKLNLKERFARPVLTRERQIFAVRAALEALNSALEGYENVPLDCTLVDIRAAYTELCSLTGEDVAESVVDEIFSKFCVGK